jgi:Calx-beta domain
MFHSLISRLKPRATARPRRYGMPRRTFLQPAELLEVRCLPSAMFTIGDVTIVEGNSGSHNALVTVGLTEPHGNNVMVDYATADGEANAGSDYDAVSGRLTFKKNETSKSILIPIRGDRLAEPNENFTVRLSNPKGGGAKIADGLGFVHIVDDEPRVSIRGARALEGNSGTTSMVFTVSLSAAYDVPVTVDYATADASAIAGIDYTAASGTLTFAPNETIQTITVEVNGDRVPEPNEGFYVNLSTPDSAVAIGWGVGVGEITDDEPHISIGEGFQDYNGTSITFTVSLAFPSDQEVTVDFATVDGPALAGVDYVADSGTLTFKPGDTTQTITVALIATDPAYKFFSVYLSNLSTNALLSNESAIGYWYCEYCYDPGDTGDYGVGP